MKKIIAIVLCLLLIAAPMAMAEGHGYDLKIGNLKIAAAGTELGLDGIELVFGAGLNDEGAGVRIAANAGGSTAGDVVLAVNSEKILLYADGVSDVYSIDLELIQNALSEIMSKLNADGQLDLNALLGAALNEANALMANWVESGEKIVAAVSGAVVNEGEVDLEGETAQRYVISLSEENAQIVIEEICNRLSELMATLGQTETAQAFATMANSRLRFSVEGFVEAGDTRRAAEIRIGMRDQESNTTTALLITEKGEYTEENGRGTMKIDFEEKMEKPDGIEDLVTGNMEVYSVNGEFAGFEFRGAVPGASPVVIKLDMPVRQADGLIEFSMFPEQEENTELNLKISDEKTHLMFINNDNSFGFTVTRIAENVRNFALEVIEGGESSVSASLDVTTEANDAAWLRTIDGETVDILTIDNAQLQKLINELTVKGLGLIGTLAGSGEELAAHLADVM